MRTFAHLINPVNAGPESDLRMAQPITFASMQRAKMQAEAEGKISVQLLSVQFPEDHAIIPPYFTCTPDLERSVLDVGHFTVPRKYPLIGDLLERLYTHSTAEYLIFTNVDIGVQPHFYTRVNEIIEAGHEAFIINRRRIPAIYPTPDHLDAIYADRGKSHPGFDCFVFKRDIYPRFVLENVCVGIPFIGILTAQNLFAFGKNFKLFDREYLTFHLGMEVFKFRDNEFFRHNQREFWKAIAKLWPHLDSRKFPYDHWFPLLRLWRWGLHPSIPIRLALKLEGKRLMFWKKNPPN
ncbi:MAG: hypothetical protein H6581_22890 [Bacteroidia bacterium]|nr:hypothetical protein [Bacteroidia bacterium]